MAGTTCSNLHLRRKVVAMTLIEACVDSVESSIAAERAGANRLELCDGQFEGGTTPSIELLRACMAAVSIPIFVMIRPRGGDFVYSAEERDTMQRDIVSARDLGVDGIVTGGLLRDDSIDTGLLRVLVETAAGLPVTFHRAFDATPNLNASLEVLIDAGVTRVLTSGGARTAAESLGMLADLVRRADTHLLVIAGGGVREHNVRDIVSRSGVREVHARFTPDFQKMVGTLGSNPG